MKDCLQQFVGATVLSITGDDESVVITLQLKPGPSPYSSLDRTVEVYNAHYEPVAVRIDGQYCPPEEL